MGSLTTNVGLTPKSSHRVVYWLMVRWPGFCGLRISDGVLPDQSGPSLYVSVFQVFHTGFYQQVYIDASLAEIVI